MNPPSNPVKLSIPKMLPKLAVPKMTLANVKAPQPVPKLSNPVLSIPKLSQPKLALNPSLPGPTPTLSSPKIPPTLSSPKAPPTLSSPKAPPTLSPPTLSSPKAPPTLSSPKIPPTLSSPKIPPTLSSPKIAPIKSPAPALPKLSLPKQPIIKSPVKQPTKLPASITGGEIQSELPIVRLPTTSGPSRGRNILVQGSLPTPPSLGDFLAEFETPQAVSEEPYTNIDDNYTDRLNDISINIREILTLYRNLQSSCGMLITPELNAEIRALLSPRSINISRTRIEQVKGNLRDLIDECNFIENGFSRLARKVSLMIRTYNELVNQCESLYRNDRLNDAYSTVRRTLNMLESDLDPARVEDAVDEVLANLLSLSNRCRTVTRVVTKGQNIYRQNARSNRR